MPERDSRHRRRVRDRLPLSAGVSQGRPRVSVLGREYSTRHLPAPSLIAVPSPWSSPPWASAACPAQLQSHGYPQSRVTLHLQVKSALGACGRPLYVFTISRGLGWQGREQFSGTFCPGANTARPLIKSPHSSSNPLDRLLQTPRGTAKARYARG